MSVADFWCVYNPFEHYFICPAEAIWENRTPRENKGTKFEQTTKTG